MQIIDARRDVDGAIEMHCDICIVGAGAAGLYLATCLTEHDVRVIVLEAGGQDCVDQASIGFESIQSAAFYKGADEGRAFGLGGTTALWGGVLAPYTQRDLRSEKQEHIDTWQDIVRRVDLHKAEVLKRLGFHNQEGGHYFNVKRVASTSTSSGVNSLDILTAEMMPFRTRKLSSLPKKSGDSRKSLKVFLNAVVKDWEISESRSPSVVGAVCCQAGNNELKVYADSFVVAAGTIESTRILLEIQRSGDIEALTVNDTLGFYLGDHLSCAIAIPKASNFAQTVEQFGPIFVNGKMKSFRFVERNAAENSARYFAHFIFDQDNAGFRVAKQALAALQARSKTEISVSELNRGVAGLIGLAWYRFANSKLYIPKGTPIRLQLDIEQQPSRRNRISLGDDIDQFGRPVAVIDWDVRAEDFHAVEETTCRLLELWPNNDETMPSILPLRGSQIESPHGTYHPVGTCRMGPKKGDVVGRDLKVNGTENLYVLSTAVFPSAGTANPTFSMFCFGEALVHTLLGSTDSCGIAGG